MRICTGWTLAAALTVVAMLIGLAGCGGGGGAAANTGSVAGVVQDFNSGVGLGGVQITVDNQTATSDANGNFKVTGITPGTYTLQINPGSLFAVPPGTTDIQVQVLLGQTTNLSGPILLVDQTDVPPSPPSG